MKLTLNKETLRSLESQEAEQVQGGDIVIIKTRILCVPSFYVTQCFTRDNSPSLCVLCVPPGGFTLPY